MRSMIVCLVLILIPAEVHTQYMNAREILAHYQNGVVVIETSDGTGTGFFVNKDGWLVTNKHVVRDEYGVRMGRIVIRLSSGKKLHARKVQVDKGCDLAVLHVDYRPSVVFPLLPTSESPAAGSSVVTIGHPHGEEWLVTEGIISRSTVAVGELDKSEFGSPEDLLNHSVASNPGNSGGPLIDEKGFVVGVVTARLEYSQNLNIGIHVDALRRFLRRNRIAFEMSSSLKMSVSDCERYMQRFEMERTLFEKEKKRFMDDQLAFSAQKRRQERQLDEERRHTMVNQEFNQRVDAIREALDRREREIATKESRLVNMEDEIAHRENTLLRDRREYERKLSLSRYMYPKRLALEIRTSLAYDGSTASLMQHIGSGSAVLFYRIGVDTRSFDSQSNPCDRIGLQYDYQRILDRELHFMDDLRRFSLVLDINERVRFAAGRFWSAPRFWDYGSEGWSLLAMYTLSRAPYLIGIYIDAMSDEEAQNIGVAMGLSLGVGFNMIRM